MQLMIKRGQIYFLDLKPTVGREQSGTRPVLVVSDDTINALPLVVTVVVGTKAANISREYPTNVRMPSRETGLPLDTVFMCFQIRSLDPARFVDRRSGLILPAGQAPAHRMSEVDSALKLVLGLT